MKYSMMGEPRPATAEELEQVIDEADYDPDALYAEISHDPWDPNGAGFNGINMTGYTAEIRDHETGDEVATTIGFEKKQDLIQLLEEAGIDDYEFLE